jgi:hypothetical protein
LINIQKKNNPIQPGSRSGWQQRHEFEKSVKDRDVDRLRIHFIGIVEIFQISKRIVTCPSSRNIERKMIFYLERTVAWKTPEK